MKSLHLAFGLAVFGCVLVVVGVSCFDPRVGLVVAGLLCVGVGMFAVRVDQ
jgi:hypothetical protein